MILYRICQIYNFFLCIVSLFGCMHLLCYFIIFTTHTDANGPYIIMKYSTDYYILKLLYMRIYKLYYISSLLMYIRMCVY